MRTQDTAIPRLTTTAGAPVADNQNSLTAGGRGPVLMQDWQLFEKPAHLKRERIAERGVHAKGWGAHGTLRITGDISHLTCAAVLQPGAETPMFARLSTVAREMGSADHERDVRGFALKFYTEEGNWDLVGNNTPVFGRDPLKFTDFSHTQKRHPRTNLRSAGCAGPAILIELGEDRISCLSWNRAPEPGCPDDVGTDAIEAFIDPRHRQDCRDALRATHDRMAGPPRDRR